ncbi:Cof subfamily protein (haloacid dehalogenase superfamily) [Natronobacillus azotifigens]|uniref:Cof-type HAD-IIB family hydrolase n=1 Tax=Natronobacillus azotifigens TaxID=472978 RepID=A0A9J6R7W2_9BACI|nr:Cof-type HAD-IIB family hydrolase [Natronobacillus azotifigens]MCZ0701728.1 Cof-type HAD-IIB family hydrolase [Natronobacillus azotifigens]
MKVIATDLDGTLLSTTGEISSRNAQAIRKAQEAGITVIVATGRSYHAAHKPLKQAGLTCPIICLNGANIYTENGTITRSIPLSKSVSKEILALCQEHQAYFELYTSRGVFSTDRKDFMKIIVNIILSSHPDVSAEEVEHRAQQRFQEDDFQFTNDFHALLEDQSLEVFKALAFSLEANGLDKIKAPFKDRDEVVVTSSGYDNAEFNHPEAQKGIALQLFLEDKNIDLADVMAIGDNYNDLSMLEIVGRGVAMGNAEQGVKNSCSFETLSNDEDGVAHAIETVLK